MTEANLIQLCDGLDGVETSQWDCEITWLAGQDPSVVTAICGLIHGARQP